MATVFEERYHLDVSWPKQRGK